MLDIDLHWFLDSKGYRLIDNGAYGTSVVGNGGKLEETSPTKRNDFVFKAFSKVSTPHELLRFVERYGLLNAPAYGVSVPTRTGSAISLGASRFKMLPGGDLVPDEVYPDVEGEDVDEHLGTAKLFREVLAQAGKGWTRVPGPLADSLAERLSNEALGEIGLRGDFRRGLRITLTASSLLNAMWLQLASKISEGTKYRHCELASCGKLFEVGSKSGRRADSLFCSDVHRIAFNSRKRTKRAQ